MSWAYEANQIRLRAAAYEAKATRERKASRVASAAIASAYGLALVLAALAVAVTH